MTAMTPPAQHLEYEQKNILCSAFHSNPWKRKKERKKELIISETHQKYYDLNTNNKKEQSIRFGSSSVHLKESFLKVLCGNNFMFFQV